MNILFITSSVTEINEAIEYNRIIINELIIASNNVGFCSNDKRDIVEFTTIDKLSIYSYSDYQKYNWDIMIVQNSETYQIFKEIKNEVSIPIIFICHSSNASDKIILAKNLFKVINVYDNIQNYDWGCPAELINKMNYPIENNYHEYTNVHSLPYKALIIFDKSDQKIESVRNILITFNLDKAKKYQVTILGLEKSYIFENAANNNIKFIKGVADTTEYIKDADVVIGSGLSAYKSIMAAKPFIVAGVRGFGGLVTPENINDFRKNNFEGRIGAELYEPIPPRILSEEINKINFEIQENIEKIIRDNRKMIENECSKKVVVQKIIDMCDEVISLNNRIVNFEDIIKSKPKIATNIAMKADSENNSCYVIRNPFNNTIAKVHKNVIYLLNSLDGEKTIIELLKMNNFYNEQNCKSFVQMIRKFWEEKIIVFN